MSIENTNIYKKIIANFFSLSLIQVTNFITPLITFPYLIRVVGLEKFGIISYGLTVITYFIIIVDYGFNLSATRQVALHKDDTIYLSRLFGKVMTTKLWLFLVSTLIMLALCILTDRFRQESIMYLIGMLYVLGNTLTPVWLFQGLEQMKYITYSNTIAKVVQLLFLFVFIRSQQDYILVLGIYGIANVIAGIYSIRLAFIKYNIIVKPVSIYEVWEQLSEGWYFFSSSLSLAVANNATMILLGFFVSNTEIAYYSIAEKTVFIIWTMLGLFSQTIYPNICRLAEFAYIKVYNFTWNITAPIILLTGIGCLLIYLFAEEFIFFVVGYHSPQTIYILRSIIVVPLIVSLNIPPYQILLAYDYKKEYTTIFNGSAFFNLILCTALIYRWGVIGAVICMIITQTLVTVSLHTLLAIKSRKLE